MARKRSSLFSGVQSFLKYGFVFFLSLAIAVALAMPFRTNAVTASAAEILLQGQQLYERQDYTGAIEQLHQAVSVYKQQDDKLGMAIAWSNLSLVHQQLRQWQQAERAIVNSLDLLPTASPQIELETAIILAQTLNIQGSLYFKQGKFQAALDTWKNAMHLQAKDRVGTIRNQLNQARAMSKLGMYFQAEKTLTDTAGQIKTQSDSALKAEVLRSLGNVYRQTGDLANSRQTLERSLTIARANEADTGDIFLSLGNTASAQSQLEAASNYYQQAIANTDLASTRIKAQLNYLGLLKDVPTIRRLANRILSQLDNLPPSNDTVIAKINLIESLQRLSQNKIHVFPNSKLVRMLVDAKQQAEKLGNARTISYAIGNLAEIYAAKGSSQQAIDLTQQALYWGQAANAPELTYRWQWQLGRLQKQLGKKDEAIASYTEAVNDLQSLRQDLAALDSRFQFNFRQRVEPVYRELVDLLLQPQANQAKLVAARQTIESLQLVELENYFRQACLEPKTNIDRLVDTDSTTAVIYPIALSDRLEIIVKIPNRELFRFTTEVKLEELQSTATNLRVDLLDITKTATVKEVSQKLYQWSIEPLETVLTENKIDTLVFVLEGSLRNIPMSILYDDKHQQYLIEKYAIAIAPALQLVTSQPLTPTKLNVLTAGISQSRTIANRRFSSLIGVEQELEQIQSQVAKSDLILNRQFTQANLEKKLDRTNFSTVHLATHGKFSSNPEQTFILAWDKLLNTNDLANLMRQYNLNRDDVIELLVLSACETATGDSLATLGLAGITVRAGVRSTLASLWFVDDRFSSEIMSSFYRELSQGTTKAKALQKAQIAVLQREERPYLWSSFILLGNWL